MACADSEKEPTCPPESMALSRANNHLAVHLHRLLAEEKKNVFFSPFSISTAMAMLLCAAEGETEAEMRKVLGYDDVAAIRKEDLVSSIQRHNEVLLENKNSYTLTSANCLLTQKDLQVKEEFKSILSESFNALLLDVDFQSDGQKVADQINNWVKEKTNSMIPKLVESLDPDVVMVLLNAVYFKGSWLQKFDEKSTSPENFYNNGDKGKAKTVNMMHIKEYFSFSETDSFQVLQLPYIGEDIQMMILLPRVADGLDAVESSLSSSFVLDFCQKMRRVKVKVALPRFRLEYSKPLLPLFQHLGLKRLFSSCAELGAAFDSQKVEVSDIFHKAVLEVNEEGSEAAAATKIAIMRRKMILEPVFIADHPFAFVIYNSKSNLILFMGRVIEL